MDYLQWSQEYYDESKKILRNIERLKQKLAAAPINQRRTLEDNIQQLRMIYYECIHTAAYLSSIAEDRSDAA